MTCLTPTLTATIILTPTLSPTQTLTRTPSFTLTPVREVHFIYPVGTEVPQYMAYDLDHITKHA
jgi:hypothetical protein